MSGLLYLTTCTLCNEQFDTPKLVDHLSDEQGSDIMRTLNGHLRKKHKNELIQIGLEVGMYQTALALKRFVSQDESMAKLQDWLRYQIHDSTGKVVIKDEKIHDHVAKLALPAEVSGRVEGLLRQVRDILEERGPFQPQDPTPNVARKNP